MSCTVGVCEAYFIIFCCVVVLICHYFVCFFFNVTATTEIYTLSLHYSLPICVGSGGQEVLDQEDRKCWIRRTGSVGSGGQEVLDQIGRAHV